MKLQVQIDITKINTPRMPTDISSRKIVKIEFLYAFCENSYYKPKV